MTDEDLIISGKHMGKKYLVVWQADLAYCQWVMQTTSGEGDSCDGMRRFSRYCANKILQGYHPRGQLETIQEDESMNPKRARENADEDL